MKNKTWLYVNHILTEQQAIRLIQPQLAGVEVQVVLSEKPEHRVKRFATDIYFNGERVGGMFSIDA